MWVWFAATPIIIVRKTFVAMKIKLRELALSLKKITTVAAAKFAVLELETADKLDKPLNITYAQLKALRDSGELEAGRLYRITDYVTTVGSQITNARSAGHRFDLVVLATSSNTIAEEAQAVKHEYPSDYIPADTSAPDYQEKYDEVHYFDNVPMERWKIDYCLDNDTSKFDWACNADYTFINITSDPVPYNEHLLRYAAGDAEGADYPYCWGDSYFHVYTASETPAVGDTAYGASDGTGNSYTLSVVRGVAGKGVIYHMIDENNNDIPYDFKNIQFLRYKNAGKAGLVVNSSYLTEDISGALISRSMKTIASVLGDSMNANNYPFYYTNGNDSSNPIKDGSSLSGNYVGYDMETSVSIDTSAKYIVMTGVGTSSKPVLVKAIGTIWLYTFHLKDGDNGSVDISLRDGKINNNKIGVAGENTAYIGLSNIVFMIWQNSGNYAVYKNYIGDETYPTTIGGYTRRLYSGGRLGYATIGSGTNNLHFEGQNRSMFIGNGCSNIKFFKNLSWIVLGSSCASTWISGQRISLGNNCTNNYFGPASTNICFGDSCMAIVVLGSLSIVLGTNYQFVKVISGTFLLFGDSWLSPLDYVRNCEFSGMGMNLKIVCAETTSLSKCLRYIKYTNAPLREQGTPKTITVPVAGQDYEIEYKTTDSQTIFV